jgi:hypothetical protein
LLVLRCSIAAEEEEERGEEKRVKISRISIEF